MESKNQTIKQFYARYLAMFRIFVCIIAIIVMLVIAPELWYNTTLLLLVLVISIWQYFMVYITIGEDFITLRPAPVKSDISVLFDEIKSVRYEPKKIFIEYCNKISKQESILKISLSVLDNDTKTELLNILHTVLKDKES
jgi:ABC-type transport system involved in Fe-S cluster assembly fused permease/ATPase subunit